MRIDTQQDLDTFLRRSDQERRDIEVVLSEGAFEVLSHADLSAFCHALSQCKTLTMRFEGNGFSKLNTAGFEVLRNTLSQWLNEIYLGEGEFSSLKTAGFNTLENILSQYKALQTIILDLSQINKLNLPGFEAFGNALSQSKTLHKISLDAGITELSTTNLEAFVKALSQCKTLHTIDLSYNDLDKLDTTCFEALWNALPQCKTLHTINLSDNNFNRLDPARFETLFTGLEKCETLCDILGIDEFNPEQKKRLNEMLDTHKALRDRKFELKNREPETPPPVIKDPEWLFYDSPKKVVIFTPNDTDSEPVLERLWAGHGDVIYKKEVPEGKKRRTLVLNDFTAMQWSLEKKAKVKQKLLSLISKGSDVYVYQDPAPIKLSAQNIDLIDSPKFSIPLVPSQTIDALMQPMNIPKDQIAYLDTPHLKELLGEAVKGITLTEFIRSGYTPDVLKTHLSAEMPGCPIVNTIYNTGANKSKERLINDLKQKSFVVTSKISDMLFMLNRENNNWLSRLQENASTLRNLSLSGSLSTFNLDPESISTIKNLESFSANCIQMPISILFTFLKNNTRLRKLDLSNLTLSEQNEVPEAPITLTQLESLKISCLIKKNVRDAILKSSESLKVLEFYGDLKLICIRFPGLLSMQQEPSSHSFQAIGSLT